MTAHILEFRMRRSATPAPMPADPLLTKARAALATLQAMQAARRPSLIVMRTTTPAPPAKDGRA